MKYFACRLDGHMKGSRACKKEKPKAPSKGKKEKEKGDKATTRQVEDSSQGDSTDSEEAPKTPRREKWLVANGPWREISPRERKRRQVAAKKRDKEQRDMPYQLRSKGRPMED